MPAIRGAKSKKKTRRHTRDIDQIDADIKSPRHLEIYKETKAAEELPALGAYYCIECAKWFDSETNIEGHKRGKPHKRRVKQLLEGPHTQKEADEAIGLRTDNGIREKQADTMQIET